MYVRFAVCWARTALLAPCPAHSPGCSENPRTRSLATFDASQMFASEAFAEMPSSFNTSCTCSTAGLLILRPSKYCTSITFPRAASLTVSKTGQQPCPGNIVLRLRPHLRKATYRSCFSFAAVRFSSSSSCLPKSSLQNSSPGSLRGSIQPITVAHAK